MLVENHKLLAGESLGDTGVSKETGWELFDSLGDCDIIRAIRDVDQAIVEILAIVLVAEELAVINPDVGRTLLKMRGN